MSMKTLPSSVSKDVAVTLLSITVFLLLVTHFASQVVGQEPASVSAAEQQSQKVIREPIHRVPMIARNIVNAVAAASPSTPTTNPNPNPTDEATIAQSTPAKIQTPAILPSATKTISEPIADATPVPHPLDEAITTAEEGLARIRATIKDYSAILVKRERVNGTLMKPEYMQVKIRSERVAEDGEQIPFSVYMKFLKPQASAGRELIYVKGRNEHQAGMENLVVKLIEKATRDRAAGACEVEYRDGVRINGRSCSVIEVVHPEQRAPYDFHIAKVYIDDELNLPIRYQAHIWPEAGQTKPQLLEEYTYINVKVNQGFTDIDFSPENPLYKYPGR